MTKIFKFFLIYVFFTYGCVHAAPQEPINKLDQIINSLQVEGRWQKGKVINCRTGETLVEETQKYQSAKLSRLTHCSCFVYAVASALGLPPALLPPHPENDTDFIPALSNVQAGWYEESGEKYNWKRIHNEDVLDDYIQAQKFANDGYLVVASYKNKNPKKAGHTAVVVPSRKSIKQIKLQGPDIAQAGNHNFSSGSLKRGFKNKKGAFRENNIKFYYYDQVIT